MSEFWMKFWEYYLILTVAGIYSHLMFIAVNRRWGLGNPTPSLLWHIVPFVSVAVLALSTLSVYTLLIKKEES